MKLSEIHCNPKNPRLIKDDRFKKLCQSIKEFPKMMALRPIIVDSEGLILGGNMRFKALKELGYKEVPDEWVKRDSELTEAEKQRFIIADNVGFGDFEWGILNEEWDKDLLIEWGLDIPDIIEKIKPEEGEDYIPDISEQIVGRADLVEMNNHRLLCGDSCDMSNILILMNGKRADMIFTDPPYDLEDNYSQNIFNAAKDDCHIFIMDSDKHTATRAVKYMDSFRRFFTVDRKSATGITKYAPMSITTIITEFLKGKSKFKNIGDGFTTLIESSVIHKPFPGTDFCQSKRVELPELFVLHYSKPDELICDFFAGAGSTLIACEKNNRICYLNEFEPRHCAIILKRWILYMKEHNRLFEVKINGEKVKEDIIKNIVK